MLRIEVFTFELVVKYLMESFFKVEVSYCKELPRATRLQLFRFERYVLDLQKILYL